MEPKLLTADRFVDPVTQLTYRYVLSDTEYFRPHYHDYYEVFIILNGNVKHIVNGAEIALTAKDLVFVRPEDTHDYLSADGKSFSLLNITFSSETAGELFGYLGNGFPTQNLLKEKYPPTIHLTSGEADALDSKMKNIVAISAEDTDALKTNLRILLFDIFSKYFFRSEIYEKNIPSWLEELCSQMRKSENFIEGTDRMYELCDRSREHISRSMKKYLGVTVTEFINNLRLNYIASMLKNSNHSIAEIVFESGFNNLSWANEQFKAKFSTTMSKYRKT